MNYLAIIQSEFLKVARKWQDMSLEDQKMYLKRHPKSKKKLTAKPKSKDLKEKLQAKKKEVFKLPGQELYQKQLDAFRQKLLEKEPYIYHSTDVKNLKNIKQHGFNKDFNYFSIGEGWRNLGSGEVKIKTADVIDKIFPDPEGDLPDKYVEQILKTKSAYSWEDVRKHPEMVKALFDRIEEQYDNGLGSGSLVIDGPISSELIIDIKDHSK